MALFKNCVVFENWEDFGETLRVKFLPYGIVRVTISDKELTLVGDFHRELHKYVSLTGDEEIQDFESIDDVSKRIGHTFPIEKVPKLLELALGYKGRISVNEDEILYIREESIDDEISDTIFEQIEYCNEMFDIEDSKEDIARLFLETLKDVCSKLGNKNLEIEIANSISNLD